MRTRVPPSSWRRIASRSAFVAARKSASASHGERPARTVGGALDRLFLFNMPLIGVCKGLETPPYLIQRANECQVPVLRTPLSTTPFIHSLTAYLDHMFAPGTTVHGSLVDVYGCGL